MHTFLFKKAGDIWTLVNKIQKFHLKKEKMNSYHIFSVDGTHTGHQKLHRYISSNT